MVVVKTWEGGPVGRGGGAMRQVMVSGGRKDGMGVRVGMGQGVTKGFGAKGDCPRKGRSAASISLMCLIV